MNPNTLPLPDVLRQPSQYFALRAQYHRDHGREVSWLCCCRHYLAWRQSLRDGRSPIVDRVPWVVFPALDFLRDAIMPGQRVFEFGMGGSTLFFLDRRCDVRSVDHDPAWFQAVRDRLPSDARWQGEVRPPTDWPDGEVRDPRFVSAFPGYETRCFKDYVAPLAAAPDGAFDVILVDGRARAGCLEIATAKLAPGGLIILDNAERARYAAAQDALRRTGWRELRFSGPGPYVRHEFWDTTVWSRMSR